MPNKKTVWVARLVFILLQQDFLIHQEEPSNEPYDHTPFGKQLQSIWMKFIQ